MANSVISLPFSFNSYGQIATTSDPRIIWKNRVRQVLLTRFGERLMIPSFGSGILNTLFETEETAAEMIGRAVTIAFNEWLSALKLISINPVFDPASGALSLSITYALPSGEQDSLSVKTSVFNRSGDLVQEIVNG